MARSCKRVVRNHTGAEINKKIQSGKAVVVQFASPHCGACHETNPHIDKAANELCGDAEVVRVNVDTNDKFADNHKVEDLPTVAVYKNGKEVARTVGADTAGAFVKLVKQALKK